MAANELFSKEIHINGRTVAPGRPCYLIAEIGSNHNGDYETAVRLIRECARAGADAVKFQDFSREDLFIPLLPRDSTPDWQEKQTLLSRRWDMLPGYTAKPEWWPGLSAMAREEGVDFLCSPFSLVSVTRLQQLDLPAWKIASGDVTWLELIQQAGKTGKPLIISTGASDLGEVADALDAARSAGCREVVLLHCVSNYPPRWEDASLRAIPVLSERFGVPCGLSDHSPGSVLPVAALLLGCCLIEKHVTLDRDQTGLDHHFAMTIPEFAQLVRDVRHAEQALAGEQKHWVEAEEEERYWVRRGLWTSRPIRCGETVRRQDLVVVRPAQGLGASALDDVLGSRAERDLPAGHPLTKADISLRRGGDDG